MGENSANGDNPIGEFLRARRERVQPADVGIPPTPRRRVKGLRREEAARLAGISSEYYLRLEQGRDQHPSDSVLAGLARALLLDEAATAYLFELARPHPTPRVASRAESATDSLRQLLDVWTLTPAYVQGHTLDVLASNALARALSPIFTPGTNLVRAAFLDPHVKQLWRDWTEMTSGTVAGLRAQATGELDDRQLAELVAEMTAQSDDFARLWARHDVRPKGAGRSVILHPDVGELDLRYEKLAVSSPSAGQVVVVYHADPGSSTEAKLKRLHIEVTAPS
ncbi:helix-turn-helix transcriptional regulator [Herbiconiux sp. CPCC 205763]|uniref:Helix-turn-helix transcriptional regulator n=1 Tax=Herbiconiux aconitum TaxID=2970913 RepID=A0ABT2GRC4_9MICO|nr:helix-turn-helix transcriptional regulator [Herbiconiux aconitum]MCS5718780.1 helix-turn-helix transcriptional regulator [Herbiconiux aconitum]